MERRRFIGGLVGGAVAAKMVGGRVSAAGTSNEYLEPARKLPLRDDADVIVCGGGPAGIAAAITAARCGARVRLFELQGCLGGVWTAGLLTYIFDFNKPGIAAEIAQRLDARAARTVVRPDQFVYATEDMRIILEEMCAAAKIQPLLHTRIAAAHRDGARLTTVVTESKAGRQAWRAPIVIDATGDGDVAALAGCGWDIGQGTDCACQPMTLNAMVTVRDVEAISDCISFYRGSRVHIPAVERFLAEIRRAGEDPSYGHPTLFHARDNLLTFMINHEYGIKPFENERVSEATIRARAEVHRIAAALRRLGGRWSDLQVVATAEQIGIRDGRRIHGRYTVSKEDLVAGARHPDAVARATFNVDIHAATREKNQSEPISHGDLKMKPYDIPLRALIARDVDGLMMAGRCISGDFIAHASYRVTGNAVAMGEAAGAVAAIAAASNRLPHQVEWTEAEATLRKITNRG